MNRRVVPAPLLHVQGDPRILGGRPRSLDSPAQMRMMRTRPRPGASTAFVSVLLVMVLASCGPSRVDLASRFPIVPWPAELEPGDGDFVIGPETRIFLGDPEDPELRRLAEVFAEPIRRAAGVALPVSNGPAGGPLRDAIVLRAPAGPIPGPVASDARGVGAEAYELEVTPDRIDLEGASHGAIFRGLQTLRQLLPVDVEYSVRTLSPWADDAPGAPRAVPPLAIPSVDIDDAPRFEYRGMHLDVGRHFFPVEFVKKYIDLLAKYRMNTFHWHLTEDQGWRIEILKYPRLTEVGGCRAETMVEQNFDPYVGDGTPYCGFYTQEEIREVVEYATERYITIVPEIEMPGHSLAALAAYPGLACTDGPFEVGTRWGVYRDIYCPTEETFEFLEDVLTEVMALFPGPYVHIGGDEAPKDRWEESLAAQEVMRRESLSDEEELQSWFVRRIERFLNANGRRLIGWDEILEGGLAPDATVMSWRGMEGGIAAARMGHDVIMTPSSHLYFDHYQAEDDSEPLAIGGFTPLEQVYDFEPVPDELAGSAEHHVLGAQANVWTEYMKSSDHVEYMALPRLLALSEVAWSPRGAREWEAFRTRLERNLSRLDALGVTYRVPDWMR